MILLKENYRIILNTKKKKDFFYLINVMNVISASFTTEVHVLTLAYETPFRLLDFFFH